MKTPTHIIIPIALPSVPSLLRSPARTFLLTAAAILPLLLALCLASSAFADSATWKSAPTTSDWNTASNWSPATVPSLEVDGIDATATFATSNTTAVSLSAPSTTVNGIVFNSGASAFTITCNPVGVGFAIDGVGITNNSALTQSFVSLSDAFGASGITFSNSATAGSQTAFTVSGFGGSITFVQSSSAANADFTVNGSPTTGGAGVISFYETSTAANGIFNNNGGTVSDAPGGETYFGGGTAGNATLIANAANVSGAGGGSIVFANSSLGGTARVEVFGNGTLDISSHGLPGLGIGSIEGSGTVLLGADKLTVGANNLSTTFSGVITDGTNGTGGSLSKIGKGKLTLTNANTYPGGTTVTKGTLIVKNTAGSATGTGAVQVNTGTLQGVGKIDGVVTVGNGTATGAILLAGNSATSPGTLTVNNAVTFQSLSTYKCVFKRATTFKASKLTALGVTINSNATFTFLETGTGTPPAGLVFTVINNTSANPIAGTFSNLPNGSILTSNGTNFLVNYSGGNGNDLTLTVQ